MKNWTRVLFAAIVIAVLLTGLSPTQRVFAARCVEKCPPPVPVNTPPSAAVEFCNTLFAPDSPINAHYEGWSIFGTAGVDPYVPHKVGLGLGTSPVLNHPLILQLGGTVLVVTLFQTEAGGLDWKLISGQASHCPPPK